MSQRTSKPRNILRSLGTFRHSGDAPRLRRTLFFAKMLNEYSVSGFNPDNRRVLDISFLSAGVAVTDVQSPREHSHSYHTSWNGRYANLVRTVNKLMKFRVCKQKKSEKFSSMNLPFDPLKRMVLPIQVQLKTGQHPSHEDVKDGLDPLELKSSTWTQNITMMANYSKHSRVHILSADSFSAL